MEENLRRVAQSMRLGQHREVEATLKSLEDECTAGVLKQLIDVLLCSEAEDAYFHVVVLKVLRFGIVKCQMEWAGSGDEVVSMLMNYGTGLSHRAFSSDSMSGASSYAQWRPVFAEVAGTISVVLKLSCVRGHSSGANVTNGLLALLAEGGHAQGVILRRLIVQRTLEEFGLYDNVSKRRSVAIRLHIVCRREIESANVVLLVAQSTGSILFDLASPNETLETLTSAASLLVTCLSWFRHRFVDDDEDVTEDSTTDSFEVPADWKSLLLSADAAHGHPGLAVILWDRLNRIIDTLNTVNTTDPEPMVKLLLHFTQAIRLLCSFRMVSVPPALEVEFFSSHFDLCIGMLKGAAQRVANGGEQSPPSPQAMFLQRVDERVLPAAGNGTRRLVAEYTDLFLQYSESYGWVQELTSVTELLLAAGTNAPSDELEESCLWAMEELLNAWLGLVLAQERNLSYDESSCSRTVTSFQSATARVFERYVKHGHSLVRDAALFEDREALCQTFDHMVGTIGRVFVPAACSVFHETLNSVATRLLEATASFNAATQFELVREVTSTLRVLLNFIADSSEGEQSFIPSCFFSVAVAEAYVIPLLQHLMDFFCDTLATAPLPYAVYECYIDVIDRFVKVYIEAEESNSVYDHCFGGGAALAVFSVRVCEECIRRFHGTNNCDSACNLLASVVDKSSDCRLAVSESQAFSQLFELVNCEGAELDAITRGKISACLAVCVSSPDFLLSNERMTAFLSHNETPVRLLYNINWMVGMASFLRRPDSLQAQYASILTVSQHLIGSAFLSADNCSVVLHALRLSRELFSCFSASLNDVAVLSLLSVLKSSMSKSVESLVVNPQWYTEEAVECRHALLQSLSAALYEVAVWKALDCFLSDVDVAPLEETGMNTMAFLLTNITEEERKIPEIDGPLFTALDHCSSAFTRSFVTHKDSACFMNAILYAIHQKDPHIQLAGVHVISSVAEFFCNNGNSNDDVMCQFVCVLLRSVVEGETSFRNTKHLCHTILKIASTLSPDRLSTIFQYTLTASPQHGAVLNELYVGLQRALSSEISRAEALAFFERVAENCVSSLEQMSISSSR